MKKKILTLFIALLITSLALPTMAVMMPEISASILKYEPYPAAQGEVMKVWIKIENAGTKADNIEIRFVPEYPFSLAPGEEEVQKIGVIPGTQEAVKDFDILVDLYAPNEEKDIKFQYKWTSEQIWAELKEPIVIETTDSLVVVSDFNTKPARVKPGDEVEINMTIKNEGLTSIRTVDLTLDTTALDFFSALGMGTTKRIDFLEPKESKEIGFKIMINSNAEIKIYNIPLEIKYKDDKNREYEVSSKMGLKMNAEPDLTMFVDSSEIFKQKETGKVRAKIVNKVPVDVKYITLKIIKTPDYDILSPSNVIYIGNLDSDDFDSGEFIIEPLKKDPVLKFILEFKDTYNKDYVQEYALPLRIVPDLEKKGSKLPLFILFVLIIGGIYWYIRKKRKKAKK